ncbi:hypothetical protein D3C87_1925530 [compost metagenome]
MTNQALTISRGREPATRTIKQLEAEPRLQLVERLGNRWLGDVEQLGHLGQLPQIVDRHQQLQVPRL